MADHELDRLADLLLERQNELLATWRQTVRALPSAHHLDTPTLNDHVPALLSELIAALRAHTDTTIPEALDDGVSAAHGTQRVEDGYDIVEVVAEYNILRGCIHDLADCNGVSLQGKPFHVLNLVLDGAIGWAVETFATQRALEVQRRREEYLSFVVHDLRTPLHAISLAARVLERPKPESEFSPNASQMISSLRRNVRQLETLIAKVLEENAHLQTEVGVKVEQRWLDLWPLIENLIHDLHPVAGTDSTQLLNQVPVDLSVYADASLLRRVFQNLIANGIKYTPRGEIVIGAQQSEVESTVECWVSDNGTGIPDALFERVFEKGEADSEGKGGTGLGLAIVKTFIDAHGGIIDIERKASGGTTVRFSLPKR